MYCRFKCSDLMNFLIYCFLFISIWNVSYSQDIKLDNSGFSAEELQSQAMEMADEYIAGIAEAVYLYSHDPRLDSNSRVLIQSFLRNGVGAALDIGAGNNSNVAILDLMVLSSLQVWAFHANWSRAGIDPDLVEDVLERLRQAEQETWASGSRFLNDRQLGTLKDLIDKWKAANPDRTVVSLVRFSEFTDSRRLPNANDRNSARNLILDLTDVTESVDQARLFGERALWYAGRYPYVLGEQSELSIYRILSQPDIEKALSTINNAESILNRATDNAFEHLREQTSMVFAEFDNREESLMGTVKELHETIEASTRLSSEVTKTAEAFDRVLMRFQEIPDSDREPILITDIRDAAIESANAAEQMTQLLVQTNALLESRNFEDLISRADMTTTALVDKLFWRGLLLVVIFLAGLLLVRLVPANKH